MTKVLVLLLAVWAAQVAASSQQPSEQQQPVQTSASSLDYEFFKTQVQPILTSARKGNARCIACHSRGGGNSYLEALPPGSTTYTEEQSRRNFARVQRLVVPGQPLKSPLLVNPLAEEAGGSHWHGGGKHWHSQDDPEWKTLAAWVNGATTTTTANASAGSAAALDYETFKTKVQPILISPRKGNARCVACHSRGGGNSYLEALPPGSTTYTEEQSRRNFERVRRLVVPGEPLKSPLLINPLAEEAGGSHWHGGGKHWHSQNDPEWQILAAWVRGS
jgi:cytochrome c553